jgi:hypothetical protein
VGIGPNAATRSTGGSSSIARASARCRQLDHGRKLRLLSPGGLQLAHALFPLGMPLGGTLGLVAAVTGRLVHRRVQAVTLGPKLPGWHGPQVHRPSRVRGQLPDALDARAGVLPVRDLGSWRPSTFSASRRLPLTWRVICRCLPVSGSRPA